MNPFTYSSPTDLPSALDLLGKQWGTTEILAGGTDLLALLKDDIVAPSRLVNIKKVGDLDSLAVDANRGLQAGCLVTLDELAREKRVAQLYPALAIALNDAASPQIRNMATVGGNLCQRPRCWYFRNGYGLLALDANGESLVLKGDNRYHAILGNTGPAYFVSPSTIAPVLVALGAKIDIAGPKGSRSISLEEFYRIPLKPGEREHDLAPSEMVIRRQPRTTKSDKSMDSTGLSQLPQFHSKRRAITSPLLRWFWATSLPYHGGRRKLKQHSLEK